ncbi:hypothetical protein [Aeromicrobium sp. UC242_57]|uniref:hypothetical protein n=1 Tax=Aeromicrobium sp. UC242_57 TaxID=3374624 RepID=UPI0037B469C6
MGANLYTVKGVRGSLPGAYRPGAPSAVCTPSLNATGGSYFRAPCVANSQIDGTDDWVLRNVNSGTVTVDEMTIFDQLPAAGDKMLVLGRDARLAVPARDGRRLAAGQRAGRDDPDHRGDVERQCVRRHLGRSDDPSRCASRAVRCGRPSTARPTGRP